MNKGTFRKGCFGMGDFGGPVAWLPDGGTGGGVLGAGVAGATSGETDSWAIVAMTWEIARCFDSSILRPSAVDLLRF